MNKGLQNENGGLQAAKNETKNIDDAHNSDYRFFDLENFTNLQKKGD